MVHASLPPAGGDWFHAEVGGTAQHGFWGRGNEVARWVAQHSLCEAICAGDEVDAGFMTQGVIDDSGPDEYQKT